jgi:hypothetical protein
MYSAEVCVVLNDSGAPLTGIAKMVCHKTIILACCAVQKIAHQLLATLRVLENAQVKHGQSELKIRVSMVRFRPRPPHTHRSLARGYGVFVCAPHFASTVP